MFRVAERVSVGLAAKLPMGRSPGQPRGALVTHNTRSTFFQDDAELASYPPLPPNASVGKRWRFRRNVVIYVAHRHGISQRVLADVFDLPRSRIASIIKEFSAFE